MILPWSEKSHLERGVSMASDHHLSENHQDCYLGNSFPGEHEVVGQ